MLHLDSWNPSRISGHDFGFCMGKGCHVHGLGFLMCPWKLQFIYPSLSMEVSRLVMTHQPWNLTSGWINVICPLALIVFYDWALHLFGWPAKHDPWSFKTYSNSAGLEISWSQRYWNVLADLWQSVHISACWNHGTCCVFFLGLARYRQDFKGLLVGFIVSIRFYIFMMSPYLSFTINLSIISKNLGVKLFPPSFPSFHDVSVSLGSLLPAFEHRCVLLRLLWIRPMVVTAPPLFAPKLKATIKLVCMYWFSITTI